MEMLKFVGTVYELEGLVLRARANPSLASDIVRYVSSSEQHVENLIVYFSKAIGKRSQDLQLCLVVHHVLQEGNEELINSLKKSILSLVLQQVVENCGYFDFLYPYCTYLIKCLCLPSSFTFREALDFYEELLYLMEQCKNSFNIIINSVDYKDAARCMEAIFRDAQSFYVHVRQMQECSSDDVLGRTTKLLSGLLNITSESAVDIPNALVSSCSKPDAVLDHLMKIEGKIDVLGLDVRVLKNRFGKFEGENKMLRSEAIKVEAEKTKYVEIMNRRLGAINERFCRSIIEEKIALLVRKCSELTAFATKGSRAQCCYKSVRALGNYLELTQEEFNKLQSFLCGECRNHGVSILCAYLAMVKKQIKTLTVENVVKQGQKIIEEIEETVSQPRPGRAAEVKAKLVTLVAISKDIEELQVIKDLTQDVMDAFLISDGPTHNLRRADILDQSWGLLLLFWVMNNRLRHAELEIDLKGCAVRSFLSTKVWFGEVKSSDGFALEKGQKQLLFASSVFEQICKVIRPNWNFQAVKVLFVFSQDQKDYKEPFLKMESDILYININMLK